MRRRNISYENCLQRGYDSQLAVVTYSVKLMPLFLRFAAKNKRMGYSLTINCRAT